MPPSMQKPGHTSVRERIAAFEMNCLSDNAVIRARFIPDVKGINRYKHFHAPRTMEPARAFIGHMDKNLNQLPTLIQPGRMRLITNTSDGYEDNGVEKAPRKSSRRERLPQLNQFSPRQRKEKEKDIVDYIEQQARHALSMNPSDSESSQRTRSSSRRLNDHITSNSTQPERRTFAELGLRQNGMIIHRATDHLETSVPPRSKSAHEAMDSTSTESDMAETPGSPTMRLSTRDTATQTNKAQHSTRSVEILDAEHTILQEDHGGMEPPYTKIYKQEHREMLTAISNALDQTIDRYSRVRAEQAIIHAARKQARVWRDAKEFIATQLFPQSIQLANRSKCTHRSAADIVANIKCYP